MGERLAFVAPMPAELRPLTRALHLARDRRSRDVGAGVRGGAAPVRRGRHGAHEVVATVIGIGTERAARATAALLDEHEVDEVVVIGVAGGLSPHVTVGEVVVPARVVDAASGVERCPHPGAVHQPTGTVVTSDELVKEPERLRALADDGVFALDMETAAVAVVCEARGVRWSVYRGISDDAFDPVVDAEVAGLTRPDGAADLRAVARYLASDPRRAAVLRRLARDLGAATTAAVAAALADHA